IHARDGGGPRRRAPSCRARLRRARQDPSARRARANTKEPRAAASGDGGPGASEHRSARSARGAHGPPGGNESPAAAPYWGHPAASCMTSTPLILVSNDDGIHSEGIAALADALRGLGEMVIVAPDRERSAVSHSLTLHRPLRVEELGTGRYAIDGTPTDCVNLAINGILPRRPTLVVSGINKGANLGDDVTYSGTVSAAMEGTLLGVPSLAISLVGRSGFRFDDAARFSARLATWVIERGLPPDTLLNVNVPSLAEGAPNGDGLRGF